MCIWYRLYSKIGGNATPNFDFDSDFTINYFWTSGPLLNSDLDNSSNILSNSQILLCAYNHQFNHFELTFVKSKLYVTEHRVSEIF